MNLSLNRFTSAAIFTSLCLCLSFLLGLCFLISTLERPTVELCFFSMPIDDVSGRTSLQMAIIQISGDLGSPHPICLFILVSCLSFHSVFVVIMILVLCNWVLAHTLFYFWGVGHLIYSIK